MKWEDMEKWQRRVAVAKDVIKHVNDNTLSLGHNYLNVQVDHFKIKWGEVDAEFKKEEAKSLMSQCTVCARGAMMLTKIAKFNNAVWPRTLDASYASTKALRDCFSEDQLDLIELFYEGKGVPYVWQSKYVDQILGWHTALPDDRDRLIAIMQNIIDHDGNFNPHIEYVVEEV